MHILPYLYMAITVNINVTRKMGFFDPSFPSYHTLSWFFQNPLPRCHSLKSDKLWHDAEDFFLYMAA